MALCLLSFAIVANGGFPVGASFPNQLQERLRLEMEMGVMMSDGGVGGFQGPFAAG